MEEEDTIIIQVIFKFEDGRLYNFDVDRTTTLYEVKKILTNAAHILKNSFTLYHEGQEISKENDQYSLLKLFPNPSAKKIEFYIKMKKSSEEVDENEHEKILVKYNIRQPCKEHIGKFLVLYCLSCKKSICNECFSESHNNHEVEEKADYLMPAKILMERIFANSFMYKSDPKISNYMSCVSFRSIIKTDIFDHLRHLITELENKCINCLEFFSFNEDSTEKNNDLNLELLKKYCTASFIKLKNNIDIKDILINDDVFLSLYHKLKAIKDYEINLFTENSNKYKALNTFFLPFTQEIKNMSNDLNNILSHYLNKDIYAKFKEDVSRNVVDVIQKEDVTRFMFENVNAPSRAKISSNPLIKPDDNVNKNSLTPNITQRLLPSILYLNDQKTNNNQLNSKTNFNIGSNLNSNVNINSTNIMKTTTTTTTSTNVINTTNNNTTTTNIPNINAGTSVSQSKSFKNVKDNFVITSPIHFSHTRTNFTSATNIGNITNNIAPNLPNITPTNLNNVLNATTNTSSNMLSASNALINNNMNSIVNNSMPSSNINPIMNSSSKQSGIINSTTNTNMILLQSGEKYIQEQAKEEKPKQERTDLMEIEETNTDNKTQITQSNKKQEIEEIKANLSEKNIASNNCLSPHMKKTFINIHLSPNKRDDINFDNRSAILSQNFLQQQKGLFSHNNSKERKNLEISSTTTSKIESHTITNVRNSINNVSIFSGKLIDVLNKEKDNNTNNNMELEIQKEEPLMTFQQKQELTSSKKVNNNFSNEEQINLIDEKDKDKDKEKEMISSQKNETNTNPITIPPVAPNYSVSFMYPVFKSNIVKGAVDKNTVQELKINFGGLTCAMDIVEFPQGGAYCNFENSLYFAGGKEYTKNPGKLFLAIKPSELGQNAIRLPDMLYSHWNHSMIAEKGKIYVIGGYGSNKCEVYDINSKTWKEMPDLIEKERQRSMLFVEKNFLYCFMGMNQNGFLTTVEKLNLDNMSAGWESVIVDTCNEKINLKFYGAGIIRMNNCNKIYFIGGKKEKRKEEAYKRTIYEFSFDDYKMTKSDFKIENDLVFVENKLFAMDENDCGNFINVGNGFLISMPNLVK